MKAKLNNYRQAPRKVRLVTDLIKGKGVERAQAELAHLPKRAGAPILKLLNSAIANASEKNNLYIKSISVDKGIVLKRSMPRAMGRAFPIHKHSSHIKLELGIRATQNAKLKTQK
ncbi:MAG TPA: 50S ribosomal protein L22 [Candidatus Paceibacterota bacterium]